MQASSAAQPLIQEDSGVALGDVLDAATVVHLIADQNDRDDPWEGPVPAHVLRFRRYRCAMLGIGDIDLDGHSYDPALAAEYAATPADRFPPVVHDPLLRTPVDGYHRIHAAIIRGETEVLALVGIPSDVDTGWTMS